VVDAVSARLGNTRAVCQRCYVHPAVIGAYVEGALHELVESTERATDAVLAALQPEEARMIRIVRAFAEREAVPLEERLRRSITARRRGR
jgi:DNA topoisomerase I